MNVSVSLAVIIFVSTVSAFTIPRDSQLPSSDEQLGILRNQEGNNKLSLDVHENLLKSLFDLKNSILTAFPAQDNNKLHSLTRSENIDETSLVELESNVKPSQHDMESNVKSSSAQLHSDRNALRQGTNKNIKSSLDELNIFKLSPHGAVSKVKTPFAEEDGDVKSVIRNQLDDGYDHDTGNVKPQLDEETNKATKFLLSTFAVGETTVSPTAKVENINLNIPYDDSDVYTNLIDEYYHDTGNVKPQLDGQTNKVDKFVFSTETSVYPTATAENINLNIPNDESDVYTKLIDDLLGFYAGYAEDAGEAADEPETITTDPLSTFCQTAQCIQQLKDYMKWRQEHGYPAAGGRWG